MTKFIISSIKASALGLALAAAAYAAPLPAWTANPLYFDLNTLTPGALQEGNITYPYYKYNTGGAEEGNAAALAAITPTVNGNSQLFVWSPQGSQTFSQIALKQGPGYVVWQTAAVNWAAYTGFYVTNDVVPPTGGISHVTMAGAPGTSVPDGGSTIALLGAALGLVAFVRRSLA